MYTHVKSCTGAKGNWDKRKAGELKRNLPEKKL